MRSIQKSYLPAIFSLLWSWLLLFIPSVAIALRVSFARYEFDSKMMVINTGVLKKKTVSIPFYTVGSVSANGNIFNYGRLIITTKEHRAVSIPYVQNPSAVAEELQRIVYAAKDEKVKAHEVIS